MKQMTPLITVDEIEPCLPFWTEALGFELTGTVPHGDALGFAMMSKGDVEVMYQSRASVADDVPGVLEHIGTGRTPLFVKVDALDPLVDALAPYPVVVPRRQTFYGMDEIFVLAPCGTVVGFAAPLEAGSA
ncbi:MAG: hypothetical protein KJP18_11105 [Gemmatimonadetes bacterium]|nr:hypothetical protein [Gemmatimonadota bacterium]